MPARFPTFDLWLCHNCFEVCLFEYQSVYPCLLSIGSLPLIYDVRFPLSSGHDQCIAFFSISIQLSSILVAMVPEDLSKAPYNLPHSLLLVELRSYELDQHS